MQSVLFGVHEMHETGTGVEGDCPINTKDTGHEGHEDHEGFFFKYQCCQAALAF
jgi:hypothetical protein